MPVHGGGAVGVPAAAAFAVSDVLHGEQWAPHFGSADILQGLWTLFEAAERSCPGDGFGDRVSS